MHSGVALGDVLNTLHARESYKGCPLCGDSDFPEIKVARCDTHPLYKPSLPDTIHWCRCSQCGHVFTSGYFTDAANAILFGHAVSDQKLGFDMEKQRNIAGRLVERVTAHAPSVGAWLDIGFGNGALLFAAYEWGYQAVGVDMRRDAVDALSAVGFEAHCMDFAKLDHAGRYTVISMADVLEHMPFPADALTAARRLLAPDGVLLVSTPNSGSIVWDVFTLRGMNDYWSELEHYHNFSRARLSALLEQTGFTVAHFAISERYRLGMEIIAKRS